MTAPQGRSVLRLQPAGDVPAQACDLVEQLGGGERSRIVLTALNDYAVEIPWSDLLRYNPCWPTGATASEWAFATRGR